MTIIPDTQRYVTKNVARFASQMETIGDKIARISILDVENGLANVSFSQDAAWLNVQKNDWSHQQLDLLIKTSQLPIKKKTDGDNTHLKHLHNLYKKGQLKKLGDGLFVVSNVDNEIGHYNAISVPKQMLPGLVQALHIKFNHPSKLQLQKIMKIMF